MWMARQNIFTDFKVKLETEDTKKPSSPEDESDSLLIFFKPFLYSAESSSASILHSLLKRSIVHLEKSLFL